MLLPMIVLTALGVALLLSAPLIARVVTRGGDSVGLTRILQVVAVALLVGALFLRPRNLDTTAVPPPPDSPEMRDR